ncbi:thioester domain-containing protein [Mesobacillus zeae]|uniref:thioester domain-containing protein n=1 Tax=Mesobacillus zeae TaxID=1917180 RepID=UPI003008B1AC
MFFSTPNSVKASSPYVEYLGKASYGVYVVGVFRVDGHVAFCIDHVKPTPATGAGFSPRNIYNDPRVRAILYYGYGGPANIVGTG